MQQIFIPYIFLSLLWGPLQVQAQEKQSDSLQVDTFVFGGSTSHFPFEMMDEKGHISGLNIDLIREVAKASGFHVEFKFQPWYKTREALEKGQDIDITDMYYSESRDEKVDFSLTLGYINHRVFIRPEDPGIFSLGALKGKEVIVERGSSAYEELLALGLQKELVLTETESDALLLLASGEHDFAIVSEPHGFWYVLHHDIELYSTGSPIFPQRLCFAVKEGRKDLLLRLNKGLEEVQKSGRYNQIYDKWLGVREPAGAFLMFLNKYGWWLITVLLSLIAMIILWSWTLRTKVRKRTKELKAALDKYVVTEEKLRLSEARLESTQAFSLVMMSYLNLKGKFRKVPPTLCSLLNYTEEELLQRNIQDIIVEQDQKFFDKLLSQIQEEQVRTHNHEVQLLTKDGSKIWVFTNFSVMLNEEGQPAELLLFIRDINDEKIAEEKLMRKTRDLNKLIYKLSHDLRGPLTTIMGLVNVALIDVEDTSANKFFHLISYQVDFLDAILKDLSALQSIEKSNVSHDLIDFEKIRENLHEALKDRPEYQAVRLDWNIELKEPVYCDEFMLKQILYHLIYNSIVFYDQSKKQPYTEVKVRLYKENNSLNLSVADNGIGIKNEIKPHIFKMFYRGHERSMGSGLGLYIVKNAINRLEGTIRFTSEEGKGTVFILTIPLLD